MNGEGALLVAWPFWVDDRLHGYVLWRVRPQHLNKAACPSRHLYFPHLHLGRLLLKLLMLWSAKVSCKVSLKRLVKVPVDQVDHGANSHLPTVSQALAFLFHLPSKTTFIEFVANESHFFTELRVTFAIGVSN